MPGSPTTTEQSGRLCRKALETFARRFLKRASIIWRDDKGPFYGAAGHAPQDIHVALRALRFNDLYFAVLLENVL